MPVFPNGTTLDCVENREFAKVLTEHVAYVLRHALIDAGISQSDAAKELGIGRTTLSRYLHGTRDIPLRDYLGLAMLVDTFPWETIQAAYEGAITVELDENEEMREDARRIAKTDPTKWTADDRQFIAENPELYTNAISGALPSEAEITNAHRAAVDAAVSRSLGVPVEPDADSYVRAADDDDHEDEIEESAEGR